MKKLIVLFLILFAVGIAVYSQNTPKVVHVFVALCDNKFQGIAPVPAFLGDGDRPESNLYWGASGGMKTYFKRSREWKLLGCKKKKGIILETCIFRHRRRNVYIAADAYRGRNIKNAIYDFLRASAGRGARSISIGKRKIRAGGSASLFAYLGHNGLMEFNVTAPSAKSKKKREAIVISCISKGYFKESLMRTGAWPLLWSTGLLAAEAYTLKGALDGWVRGESNASIRTRAARAYHRYQRCGLRAAKRLFVTGW